MAQGHGCSFSLGASRNWAARTELLQKALELERQSGIRGVLTSEVMGPDGGMCHLARLGWGNNLQATVNGEQQETGTSQAAISNVAISALQGAEAGCTLRSFQAMGKSSPIWASVPRLTIIHSKETTDLSMPVDTGQGRS